MPSKTKLEHQLSILVIEQDADIKRLEAEVESLQTAAAAGEDDAKIMLLLDETVETKSTASGTFPGAGDITILTDAVNSAIDSMNRMFHGSNNTGEEAELALLLVDSPTTSSTAEGVVAPETETVSMREEEILPEDSMYRSMAEIAVESLALSVLRVEFLLSEERTSWQLKESKLLDALERSKEAATVRQSTILNDTEYIYVQLLVL